MKTKLYNALLSAKNEECSVRQEHFIGETVTDIFCDGLDFDSVVFEKCRFISCDFSNASFDSAEWISNDFSNCVFKDSYWKNCLVRSCKANGSIFEHAVLKGSSFLTTPCRYINFSRALLEKCTFTGCDMRESAMSEMKLRECSFHQVDFTNADFFKTPLRGIDLSECVINGILLSDNRSELHEALISPEQAPYIASLLGVRIKN